MSSSRKSYAELVREVVERFNVEQLPQGSLREHWRISSGSDTCAYAVSGRFKRTVAQLKSDGEAIGMNSSGSKSRSSNTAAVTWRTMVRTKARGNSSLPGKERLHLCCMFDADAFAEEFYVFASREASLSALLEQVANSMPQAAFRTSARPEGVCLVLDTEDCPDWHLWDRRAVVGEVLVDFESVRLRAVPTAEAVGNQSVLVEVLRADDEETAALAERQRLEQRAAEEEAQREAPVQFKQGDLAEYDGAHACEVVAVHLDDFPNVYYTVRLLPVAGEDGITQATSSEEEALRGRERQTVGERLRLQKPRPPLLPEMGGLHLRVEWAGAAFAVQGVDPAMTVAELKAYIHRCRPAHCDLRLTPHTKLLCKGATLADKKVLSSTKVTAGAKVMLLG